MFLTSETITVEIPNKIIVFIAKIQETFVFTKSNHVE